MHQQSPKGNIPLIFMTTNYLIIFESVHKVMQAEALLKNEGVRFDIIPTPKAFSSDCGISIRLLKGASELEKVRQVLEKNAIDFKIHENSKT